MKTDSALWELSNQVDLDISNQTLDFNPFVSGPLVEMLNSATEDHQGFWDRFLFVSASEV